MKILVKLGLIIPIFGLGFTFNTWLLAMHYAEPFDAIVEDVIQRFVKHPANDGIAPAFRQSSQKTCGAAAMAYLLTKMGDLVFEAEFVRRIPMTNSTPGYSLSELSAFAEMRGFTASGYMASVDDLPKPGKAPVIAHLTRGHYVVVHFVSDEYATIFDPAYGRTFSVPLREFIDEWSGKILEVHMSQF